MIKIEFKTKNERFTNVYINGKFVYDTQQNLVTEMNHLEALFKMLGLEVEIS